MEINSIAPKKGLTRGIFTPTMKLFSFYLLLVFICNTAVAQTGCGAEYTVCAAKEAKSTDTPAVGGDMAHLYEILVKSIDEQSNNLPDNAGDGGIGSLCCKL